MLSRFGVRYWRPLSVLCTFAGSAIAQPLEDGEQAAEPSAAEPGPPQPGPANPADAPATEAEKAPAHEASPPEPTESEDRQPANENPDPESPAEPNRSSAAPEKAASAQGASETATSEPAPPPVPKPGDQQPAPVPAAGPLEIEKRVEVGPRVGVRYYLAEGEASSYQPAFAVGGYARAKLLPFLHLRGYIERAWVPVDLPSSSLGIPDAALDQGSLSLLVFGATLEPTWVINDRFSAWFAAGAEWGRYTAPEPESSGSVQVRTSKRRALLVNYMVGLGAAVELMPDWVVLSANYNIGLVSTESGSAYDSIQAFDQNGQMLRLAPLSKFEFGMSAFLNIGVLL